MSQATRDMFATEPVHVRFGAPLDELKASWDERKRADSDKIKEQKVCLLLNTYVKLY